MRGLVVAFVVLCLGSSMLVRGARAEARPFIKVAGNQLRDGARPFRFVGANVSIMHGESERRNFARVLDAVRKDGLSVVRLWALGEQPAPGKPHYPAYAFRIGESGWVEDSFVHLDRVLAAVRDRDMRAIVVLANRWKDYGGIGTYLAWAGVPVASDASGNVLGTMLSSFYTCARCDEQYRAHVRRVIERTNSLTGIPYRDDPTIMAWELINESSGVTARDEEALVDWTRRSASYVRSLDRNHLVASGHIGFGTARERAVWRRVEALPEIDYADAHAYPLEDKRISSTARLSHWIEDRVTLAHHEIKKPLVFGEFGFGRALLGDRHVGVRARWMAAFLGAAQASGASGSLVWTYTDGDQPLRSHGIAASGGDRDSEKVRRALASAARRMAHAPPAPRPLPRRNFNPTTTLRSALTPHRGFTVRGNERVLEMDALAFARSEFERTGTFERGPLAMVYGAGEGTIDYRFVMDEEPARALRVSARISSELPGFGTGEDPRDGSDVEVSIDDIPLGIVRAKPDDGLGEVVEVELRDRRLLTEIFRSHWHRLRFRALPSRYAGGICIYGRPTGAMPLEAAFRRELKAVRITLLD